MRRTSIEPANILLIQLRRIGDVLMTTPAVRRLREAMPEARLTYLTELPSLPVVEGSPRLDRVVVWPRHERWKEAFGVLWGLRRARFDTVIDFSSNGLTAFIALFIGARRRVTFAFPHRHRGYTDVVPLPSDQPYSASHKLALLAPMGLAPNPASGPERLLPELFLGEAQRRYAERQLAALGIGPGDFLVALSPVSRRRHRVWPAEEYARLADALIERLDAKVLFLWGPGEEAFVTAVRERMTRAALPDYPIPSLLEMGGLIERANLFVGNDNGPRHFAVALGTPTLCICGSTMPENWTPPGVPIHRAVAYDPGCKQACVYPRCGMECLAGVTYERVEAESMNLAQEVMRRGAADRR